MDRTEKILDVRNVTVSFDGFNALDGLDFAMNYGELRFIIGPDYMNRVVAFDALTIISISIILLLALLLERDAYIDIALVYGLLSFLGVVAVARFIEKEL